MLEKLKNWIHSFFEDEEEQDIPENLGQAVRWLKENVPEDEQEDIANRDLNAKVGHFGIGRWMRNNWGLWSRDSELYKYFERMGVDHPDDMTGIILDAFQADLRDEKFDLQAEVEEYIRYWEKMNSNK